MSITDCIGVWSRCGCVTIIVLYTETLSKHGWCHKQLVLTNLFFITHLKAKQTIIYLLCIYAPFTQRTVSDVLDTNRQCVWSVMEQVHISQSNKTGLSLPTWMDGCTFSSCIGVGEGG